MKFIKYTLIVALATCVGNLYGQKNIGINTNDPKTNLDIRGDLKVQPDELDKDHKIEITPLYRVSGGVQQGLHEIVQKKTGSDNHPFYEFNLYIPLTSDRTNVDKFATNIPSDKYILSILNSNFVQQVDGNPAAVGHVDSHLSTSPHVTGNPLKQVDAWIEDGKWYISARYNSAYSVTASGDRAWVITLLAMNTEFSKIVDPNPNYKPTDVSEPDPFSPNYSPNAAKTDGNQMGRHYDHYQPNNPQNPSNGEDQSLRGDSFKLNSNMTGGAKVDPLKQFENNN